MLTEETRALGAAAGKVAEHEAAAHDKRNWVRLTFDCNDRCVFCLDSNAHDGRMRDAAEIKTQILDGRRKGATRLILSGGEPTIHPRFVDFVRLGALAGYPKVQTVTNGRMFRYKDFLTSALDAGLHEITFSIHGPNARVHDALVGVKGAFDEEVEGLQNALDDGRPIVNIDVCVSRGNVKVLPELIETFVAMGVREYDLLQVIPFGRAFIEGRDTLFYDLEEAAESLREAFAWSRKPDMHIWLNRFPPEHCEGFEDLIQDPHKLEDEVRGRKEEFAELLTRGVAIDCREPERCRYCYLEPLCDTLDDVQRTVHDEQFDVVRIDVTWERRQPEVFGGDPASKKRTEAGTGEDGPVRLPLLTRPEPLPVVHPVVRAARAGAHTAHVVAPDLRAALDAARPFTDVTGLVLELDSYDGLDVFDATLASNGDSRPFDGKALLAVVATSSTQGTALLAMAHSFEVQVHLTDETAPWLLSLDPPPERLVVVQPTYERLTEARERDVDLPAFFEQLPPTVPVMGVPACILGRAPRPEPRAFDTAMALPDGQLEIFRYARRFIAARFFAKSLRCKPCKHHDSCRGMHINQVRAHGFTWMNPVEPQPPG